MLKRSIIGFSNAYDDLSSIYCGEIDWIRWVGSFDFALEWAMDCFGPFVMTQIHLAINSYIDRNKENHHSASTALSEKDHPLGSLKNGGQWFCLIIWRYYKNCYSSWFSNKPNLRIKD